MNVAKKTQAALIANKFPTSGIFKISSFYKPFLKLEDLITYKEYPSETDQRIDLLFGDISGHGVSAALMSGIILLVLKLLLQRNKPC